MKGLTAVLEVAADDHARPLHLQRDQALLVLAREHAILEHLHVPRGRDRAQHGDLLVQLEEIVHTHADRLLASEDGEVQVLRALDGPSGNAVLVRCQREVEDAAPVVDALHVQSAHE
jgi:hypothetical protein